MLTYRRYRTPVFQKRGLIRLAAQGGTSIVWDGKFTTDQAALDELMKTIESEGIRSIVEDDTSSGS